MSDQVTVERHGDRGQEPASGGVSARRAARLGARFEALNEEIIATVAGCSDEQWRRPSGEEGWPVAVVAHHIAAVHGDFLGLVEAFAAGQTRSPGSSMDGVNEGNERHAREYATVGKEETVDALRANGGELTRRLRLLRDEQLDARAGVFGGREPSVAEVVEYIVIGHAEEHLASIRATLAG